MIIFKKISYKNILSVGNAPIEIDLHQNGRTLITGTNGAGKSTFLEALCFVLYGKPFRSIKKAQLINSVNQKSLYVELDFQDKKHTYKIIRGIRKNIFEVYKDGDLVDQDASVGDYQDFLEKHILRMNLTTFKQLVVLGTAGYTPFMLLPAGKRREVIENLLDISVFSTMLDLNKQQARIVTDEIRELEHEIEKLMRELKLHAQYQKERKASSTKEVEELLVKLQSAIHNYKLLAQEFQRLIDAADSIDIPEDKAALLGEARDSMLALKGELRTQESVHDELDGVSTCPTCEQTISEEYAEAFMRRVEAKIDEIDDKLDDWKGQLKYLNTYQSDRDSMVENKRAIEIDIRSKETERNFQKKLAEQIKDQIVTAKNKQNNEDRSDEILKISEDVREIQSKKSMKNHETHCRNIVNSILKDSGVKRMIIRQYIPAINRFINDYLKTMGANYNFTLDEEFNESIKSRGRDTFSYSSFSQGERARIDLALLFAFRDLVAARIGSTCNLLVLDEVFDSAADSDGIESISKILNSIKDNVFIISHNEKHDKNMFDEHIRFQKMGLFTKKV